MTGHPLPLTGERTLPDVPQENYWFRRHEVAYRWARERVAGTVVDAGCGEGYGAALLARRGAHVLAIDLVEPVVAHVAARYPTVRPVQANLVALPLADACADALVCLQVIEHLWDQQRFVEEAARVLRPGGALLCSTPNRRTFSAPDTPRNPHHSVELDASELVALLAGRLEITELAGLHHGPGLAVAERAHGVRVPTALARAGADLTAWPAWLRDLVGEVTIDDFAITTAEADHLETLDDALDLLVVARAPEEPRAPQVPRAPEVARAQEAARTPTPGGGPGAASR